MNWSSFYQRDIAVQKEWEVTSWQKVTSLFTQVKCEVALNLTFLQYEHSGSASQNNPLKVH